MGKPDRCHDYPAPRERPIVGDPLTCCPHYSGEERCRTRPSKDLLAYLDPFRQWMRHEPERLLAYLRDPEAPPFRLTFAAEVAGYLRTTAARDALLALTHHGASVVREGAVIGLGNLGVCPGPSTVQRIREMVTNDPSPGVRNTAEGFLSGVE